MIDSILLTIGTFISLTLAGIWHQLRKLNRTQSEVAGDLPVVVDRLTDWAGVRESMEKVLNRLEGKTDELIGMHEGRDDKERLLFKGEALRESIQDLTEAIRKIS